MITIHAAQTGDIHLLQVRLAVEQMLKDGQSFLTAEPVLQGLFARLRRQADLISQFGAILERDIDVAEAAVADAWGALNDTHPDHDVDLPFRRPPAGIKKPALPVFQAEFLEGQVAFSQKIQWFEYPKAAPDARGFYWLLGWFYGYWGGQDAPVHGQCREISDAFVRHYAECLDRALESETPRPLVAQFHDILCAMLTQMGITVFQGGSAS